MGLTLVWRPAIKPLIALAILASAAVLARPATAAVFTVDGESFDIGEAPGFCFLSRDDPRDQALVFDRQDRLQAGTNKVIAVAVDCAGIDAFRRGEKIGKLALWLVLAPAGKLYTAPANETREQFVAREAKSIPSLDIGAIADRVNQSREGDVSIEIKKFGLLDADKVAIYVGLLVGGSGKSDLVASVSATTSIKGRVLTIHFYDEYRDIGTFDTLLSKVREQTYRTLGLPAPTVAPALAGAAGVPSAMEAARPAPAAPSDPSAAVIPPDGATILGWAAGVALATAIAAGLYVLLRRRRSAGSSQG